MNCYCNATYGQAHALGCPLYTGTRHVCGPTCTAARLRLRYTEQARPMDAPMTWRRWVGAVIGGMSIFVVAIALAVIAGVGKAAGA